MAAFVGDANLVPAELHGKTARCALGTVSLRSRPVGADGTTVTLLVRPEQLRVTAAPAAGNATVDEVVFYGPHALVRLSLDDGSSLQARVDPAHVPPTGERVGVEVAAVSGVFA